ncbi:histidine--tRNA ligase [Paenibacillus mucilaginosus]|uniref:Histidine--tRNA ligase n=1 Tax=Paenibacillus mucilaginosus (strain KNP414) TaxID=1036673 RepID=F8FAN7_PAEMK|nr:histidine--tRNA ligase [Paenibacillus mucilaginosus]AEI41126.1 histidyl-tRNA synthetase [Paenibacillus mucilaginosus KNP414]MCG7211441.1 histidine--tRNA ligase [Paenibacillus mucilaginosus]WDM30182.1 histidine--tRNA ligase [Paenibacillus mucilaginosus]
MKTKEWIRPRGTADVLPEESFLWHRMEDAARKVARLHHAKEIRTPLLEYEELYSRSVGDATDIVEKEMYTLTDRGGRQLALRPEGTAGTARAVIQGRLFSGPLPLKLYYIGPMFRYERPGQGRLRQHTQFGVEAVGSASPLADAELMAMALRFYEELGVTGLTVSVGSVGCEGCRRDYAAKLKSYLRQDAEALCTDCLRRLELNPLRTLDCKQPGCRSRLGRAPQLSASLCPPCRSHAGGVDAALDSLGLPYERDPLLVRGLDYYTGTVFEIQHGGSAVSGGGRYNALYAELGGPPLPAAGFGVGLERTLLLLRDTGALPNAGPQGPDVWVVPLSEAACPRVLPVLDALRRAGMAADSPLEPAGWKGALKTAVRAGASYLLVLGEEEDDAGMVEVKDLATGLQTRMPLDAFLYRCGR